MPFHSTVTLEEAEELVQTYCRLGIIAGKPRMVLRRTWDVNDILEAMRSAAQQFGLEPG